MESIVKKYQQRFRRIKDEMGRWEELQSRLISQFFNASSIIQRLQVILDSRNYGVLKSIEGIDDAVLRKQMDSLQTILLSINKTMEEFRGVVSMIEKMVRDSRQIVGGGSAKQLKQQIGLKPTLEDCLSGLRILEEMHKSEYRLKLSVVSALEDLALKPKAIGDLSALQQLLVDQPNIPREEVQCIYEIIFAEEIF
ncbi:hypothetical protein RD792_000542 [Penstemon davidsonii]|uniref:Uncharacterized protein n=1 Tax=Penstemon davidsonii TaxID=160366 RepID=A0ABR0DLP8_9LAMI|nr:hypothetical protein RD792_000542 [Penstemon davidsonii]